MNKPKILIQIFPLLKEIDFLERTLLLLKQNSLFIDKEKYHLILDVTLPTSDYLVDWDKSILKKDYFINRLKNFEKYYLGWCDEYSLKIDDNVCGILDWFLNTTSRYSDLDSIIIIEPDVVFGPYTLNLYLESDLQIRNVSSNYIITGEYVKMWDTSWDGIVNSTYLDKPFNFRNTNDAITDTYHLKNDGEFSINYGKVLHEESFLPVTRLLAADLKPARTVGIATSVRMAHRCLELGDTGNTSAPSVALTIEAS